MTPTDFSVMSEDDYWPIPHQRRLPFVPCIDGWHEKFFRLTHQQSLPGIPRRYRHGQRGDWFFLNLFEIIDILILELNQRLAERDVELDIGDEVKQWFIDEGYQPQYGARPLRRTIQKLLGDPLSEEMIKGRFKNVRKIKVVLRDNAPFFIEEEAMARV